jgi:uncharacterized membrane protein YgaE (UPF0421/DUF939 family)
MAKTTFTAEELARCVENEFFRRSQQHARVSSMRLKMIQGANRQMAMWEEIARRLRAEANASGGAFVQPPPAGVKEP